MVHGPINISNEEVWEGKKKSLVDLFLLCNAVLTGGEYCSLASRSQNLAEEIKYYCLE